MNKTRESIANEINYVGPVFRTIKVDEKLSFEVGQVINNIGLSWQTENGVFTVESDRKYEYFFSCYGKVKGHEVDYDNTEEVEILDAVGCNDECEVLVPNSQKFIVKSISSDDDYEEMGYYEIELEAV